MVFEISSFENASSKLRSNTPYLINKDQYQKEITDHLLRLSKEDRFLRFGMRTIVDDYIIRYVNNGITVGHFLFAIFDDDRNICALVHLASTATQKDSFEIGISVDSEHRCKGLGASLFSKAVGFARALGAKRIFTYCLRENRAMQALAKKHNLKVMLEHGDVTGELSVTEVTPDQATKDYLQFISDEQLMIFDMVSRNFVHDTMTKLAPYMTLVKTLTSAFRAK